MHFHWEEHENGSTNQDSNSGKIKDKIIFQRKEENNYI